MTFPTSSLSGIRLLCRFIPAPACTFDARTSAKPARLLQTSLFSTMLPTFPFQFIRYDSQPQNKPTITLRTTTSWSHAGALLDSSSLPAGYHTWAKATVKSGDLLALLIPFLDFLHQWLAETHMTHYLLTIRAQKPTSDFDRPRWHVDRRFFEAPVLSPSPDPDVHTDEKSRPREAEKRRGGSVWKVAAAVLGPGTLFLRDSARGIALQKKIEKDLKMEQKKRGHYAVDEKHVCQTFRCLGCAEMADSIRVKLAEEVQREGLEVVQLGRGEVSVFRADGEGGGGGGGKGEKGEVAAMHSEPPMSGGDRIFVHVVPGTKEEVRTMLENWGMEFPRDWSVGVLSNWGSNV